ncbi:MAG: 50S ribosomal protein L11 methyltransferase [Proteobacteria bacterium]|nr:50S ribosomal protein L11 methyltransferase [Pseudomonadota bacterium]
MDHSVSADVIHAWVVDYMKERQKVMTPSELCMEIRNTWGFDRKQSRAIINKLVSQGDIEYQDLYGRTCLSISFSRPVRISANVILKPPDVEYSSDFGENVVSLHKGIAFGRGTHPTTRLSILALSFLFEMNEKTNHSITHALDIGTGTGVLAIVASKLGAKHVLAIDIDPVSVSEAEENVKINHLSENITVSDKFIDFEMYNLIIANLRFPTLLDFQEPIARMISPKGLIVLSGIKNEEKEKIMNAYKFNHGKLIWEKSESGWCALVFRY